MSDTVERYRKFCKIIGLHNVFNTSVDNFYDTANLEETKTKEFSSKLYNTELLITKDTILFITADNIDEGNKITHKLSDIHSVIDDDWYIVN